MAKWLRIESCFKCNDCVGNPIMDDKLWRCKKYRFTMVKADVIDPRCKLPDAPEEENHIVDVNK